MEEQGVYEAEVLQGCGHLSPLEIPEMLRHHLQDFRLLQFRVSVAIFFLNASRMRVFNLPKLSFILALLLFSLIGLDKFL